MKLIITGVLKLCPSSGILKDTKEHNVLETVSVLRYRGGRQLLCWVPEKELTSPVIEVSVF
jgi:hypothetical protein